MELPDFHIPHVDKIEWMIETNGWALEAVGGQLDTDPPTPALAYTIGVSALCGFPEIVVFGLKPVQANGLFAMVIDALRGGTEIPVGAELVGLLDNGLRCMFAPIEPGDAVAVMPTAVAWHRGERFDAVQMLYPDPNGFMPYEASFDPRMTTAQPILGTM